MEPFTQKCPRCRKGSMFNDPNPWHLKINTENACPIARNAASYFELEVGFWYGTAYLSYAVTVLFCAFSFILWFLTIGFSLSDQRFFWWMGINGLLLIILQPWFMRLSRAMYLYFFVSYNADYKNTAPKTFDYTSEDYFLREEPEVSLRLKVKCAK